MTPDKEGTEDRLCEQVKDAVEDGLAIWSDEITAFSEAPGDWVQNPEDRSESAAVQECSTNVRTKSFRVLTSLPREDVDDVAKRNAAEDEVAPLVGTGNECTDETSYDLQNEEAIC